MSATRKHDREDDNEPDPVPVAPKKHHFAPIELQKKQLEKLLEKIDKPVHIPERPGQKRAPKEPKDYVKNVQGSSAGAGSGEFHVYRAGRRREYARLKNMDLESKETREQREYEEKIEARKAADLEKTEKNRAKRQKRKRSGGKGNNKKSKDDHSDQEGEGDEGSDKDE